MINVIINIIMKFRNFFNIWIIWIQFTLTIKYIFWNIFNIFFIFIFFIFFKYLSLLFPYLTQILFSFWFLNLQLKQLYSSDNILFLMPFLLFIFIVLSFFGFFKDIKFSFLLYFVIFYINYLYKNKIFPKLRFVHYLKIHQNYLLCWSCHFFYEIKNFLDKIA